MLLTAGFSATSVAAESRFSFAAFFGAAQNLGTTLTIEQKGRAELRIAADYATRPFESPIYYAGRLAFRGERGAWEVQFTHHKLHLQNPSPEVQHFEITHGFNVLVFGRAFYTRVVDWRVLGGVVIAHPESVVRGRARSPGYELTGPALVVGAGKEIDLAGRLFAAIDGQFLAARARVSVDAGEASAPNLSLHLLFGLGLRF